jgi:hypothetical protein
MTNENSVHTVGITTTTDSSVVDADSNDVLRTAQPFDLVDARRQLN